MAHYAFLDENNFVTEVITGKEETELLEGLTPEEWYSNYRNQKCIRTSYNNRIRKQFAGIGFFYDEINDVFIAPKPYESWTLNANFDWQAPKEKPQGVNYWDEDLQEWISVKSAT